MSESMILQAPIQVEIKISITDGDGTSGEVRYAMPQAKFPTEKEMRAAIEDVATELDPHYRLMTKREWWDSVCPDSVELDEDGEQVTTKFAIPGGDTWDT